MKLNLHFFLFFIGTLTASHAQVSLQEHIVVDNNATIKGGNDSILVDIDGDGNLDAVSVSNLQNKISWFKNVDGSGTFNNYTIVSTNIENANGVASGDIDSDGDIDIISIGSNGIYWHENTNGLGAFGPDLLIDNDESISVGTNVELADIDGDNDLDAIASWRTQNNVPYIYWYINNNGSFGDAILVGTGGANTNSLNIGDVDGDGDFDIVDGSRLKWYENNDGSGGFGQAQLIYDSTFSNVQIVDVDGDNDLDVIGIKISNPPSIWWFENTNGFGDFQYHIMSSYYGYSAGVETVFADDFDGDSDTDIMYVLDYPFNEMVMLENLDGQGSFGNPSVVADFINDIRIIKSYDIDNDDDKDIIYSTNVFGLFWLENSLSNNNTSFIRHPISPGVYHPEQVIAKDIDGDNDLDIISSSLFKVQWYENMGLGDSFSIHPISAIHDIQDSNTAVGDIDNDGDIDLVVCSYSTGKITLFLNDGNENFTSETIYTGSFLYQVDVGDIDNDNDLDIVAASANGRKIMWFENIDNSNAWGGGTTISIDQGFNSYVFHLTDIENDGDLDIVSRKAGFDVSYQIGIYVNSSNGSIFTENIVTSSNSDVTMGDFNSDSFQDIVTTRGFSIELIKNFGNLEFDVPENYTTEIIPRAITAIDLDNDGDLDLSYTGDDNEGEYDKLAWIENIDGQGTFAYEQTLMDGLSYYTPSALFSADINNDGYSDILRAYFWPDKVAWLKNQNLLSVNGNDEHLMSIYPNPTKDIVTIESETPISSITVYDQLGKIMKVSRDNNIVDLSSLSQGLYFVRIEAVNGRSSIKKVIKH